MMVHYTNYCTSFSCNFPVEDKQITAALVAADIKDATFPMPNDSFTVNRTVMLASRLQ